MKKTAVVLFNLGGPSDLAAVRPFLFNLFNDKAIIGLPQPLRWLLARFISGRREKKAKAIYRLMGGKSPILEETTAQAAALEKTLDSSAFKVFIAMRYWQPFAEEAVMQIKEFAPDEIILLPLYPQFSTTTTGSSLADFKKKLGDFPGDIKTICCYPAEENFIAAHAKLVSEKYQEAQKFGNPRILFSAHGLPEKVIKAGDPYQKQVEATAAAVIERLKATFHSLTTHNYLVSYQSRVGPLKWISPYTEEEIERAAKQGVPLIVVPIAFVSEHSETLVELDIEYKHLYEKYSAVEKYFRVPAFGVSELYIKSLVEMLCAVASKPAGGICPASRTPCGKENVKCPHRQKL